MTPDLPMGGPALKAKCVFQFDVFGKGILSQLEGNPSPSVDLSTLLPSTFSYS